MKIVSHSKTRTDRIGRYADRYTYELVYHKPLDPDELKSGNYGNCRVLTDVPNEDGTWTLTYEFTIDSGD